MVKGLKDKQKGCMETIRVLEKDIQGHKKEIREREETIADKDRRISDLKKRNQVRQLADQTLDVTTIAGGLLLFNSMQSKGRSTYWTNMGVVLMLACVWTPSAAFRSWRSSSLCWTTRSRSYDDRCVLFFVDSQLTTS